MDVAQSAAVPPVQRTAAYRLIALAPCLISAGGARVPGWSYHGAEPDPRRTGASRRLARPVCADQAARDVAGGVHRAVRPARRAGRRASGARLLVDPRDR